MTDSTNVTPFIISSPETKVRHLSVVTVRERPTPLSRGRVFVNDQDINFLERHSKDIIAYYLMVDLILVSFRCHNMLKKAEHKWRSVAERLVKSYPNIFQGTSAGKCTNLFILCTNYYLHNYDKFNLKLEPQQQKLFDLLKIVHLLDPERIIKFSKRDLLAIIADQQEIKDYIYLQKNHCFDMYLNTHRMFRQSITIDEFLIKYIVNDQQILTMGADFVPPTALKINVPAPPPSRPIQETLPSTITTDGEHTLVTIDD